MFQFDIQRLDGEVQAEKLLTAGKRDRANRMIHDPGIDDGLRVRVMAVRDLTDLRHGFLTELVPALEEAAAGHGGPDQRVDLVVGQIIHHPGIEMFKADRVPFDLVRHKLSVNGLVEHIEFHRVKVGNTDLSDQSLFFQVQQSTSGFPRVKAGIFPVDQVEVGMVRVQPFQAFMAGFYDTVIGGVVV